MDGWIRLVWKCVGLVATLFKTGHWRTTPSISDATETITDFQQQTALYRCLVEDQTFGVVVPKLLSLKTCPLRQPLEQYSPFMPFQDEAQLHAGLAQGEYHADAAT
eukprot:3131424-Amphidinium_carterae.1